MYIPFSFMNIWYWFTYFSCKFMGNGDNVVAHLCSQTTSRTVYNNWGYYHCNMLNPVVVYIHIYYSIYTLTINSDNPICCALPNNNKSNPFLNFFKMLIILMSRLDCWKSINIQIKNVHIPIYCALPNNNKPNPFINFFKCRLN